MIFAGRRWGVWRDAALLIIRHCIVRRNRTRMGCLTTCGRQYIRMLCMPAIGLARELSVMVTAVVLSVLFMLVFARQISDFVHANPGIKVLALAFLVLIGVLLIAEAFGSHPGRGYVYFAMAFSLVIELLNRRRAKRTLQQ